jgi:hypothetical protein
MITLEPESSSTMSLDRLTSWSCAPLSWISFLSVSIWEDRKLEALPAVVERFWMPQSMNASAKPLTARDAKSGLVER